MNKETELTAMVVALTNRLEETTHELKALRTQNEACGRALAGVSAALEGERAAGVSKAQKITELSARLEKFETGGHYRKRPPVMRGRTMQQNVGCGPLYVTVNEDEFGRPFEVFFKLAKSGSCQQSYLEALGIVVSLSLRYGAEPQKIIEKLSGIRCPNPKMRVGPDPAALSCADGISQAIGRALELALIDGPASIAHEAPAPVAVAEPQPVLDLIGALGVATAQSGRNGASSHTNGKRTMLDGTGLCPTCHGLLIRIEGCERCMDCGHSGKCS